MKMHEQFYGQKAYPTNDNLCISAEDLVGLVHSNFMASLSHFKDIIHILDTYKKDHGLTGEETLVYLADAFGGYSVEYLPSNDDTLRTLCGVYYINMGGTYLPTLIYDCDKGAFMTAPGGWGSVVEEQHARFNLQ